MILPSRLVSRLGDIPKYPLTIIEAPSGFGKSTSVRHIMDEYERRGYTVRQCTLYSEPQIRSWAKIMDVVFELRGEGEFHHEAFITKTGEVKPEIVDLMDRLLRGLKCPEPVFLVIDNFHYIPRDLQRRVIDIFSRHECANLHIVVLCQHNTPLYPGNVGFGALTLDSRPFLFSESDIAAFFQSESITLSEEDLKKIHEISSGWIAAICLELISYRESGRFEGIVEINSLVEHTYWKSLSDEEKQLLLRLSTLDSFTTEQMIILLSEKTLPLYAKRLIEKSPFVSSDSLSERGSVIFSLHNILKDFLDMVIIRDLDAEARKLIYELAGRACEASKLYYLAAGYYLKAGQFESLMSLPLIGEEITEWAGLDSTNFILDITGSCPVDIQLRHPKLLMVFAFELLMIGKYQEFAVLNEYVQQSLGSELSISEEDKRKLEGEYALMLSFTEFNDIRKMSHWHRIAYEKIGGRSELYSIRGSWTFHVPSILALYWRVPGELDIEMEYMDECLPYYTKLANGHGSGGNHLMRAEAELHRGRDESVDALCHKAMHYSKLERQDSISIGVEFTFARLAILRGDLRSYRAAVRNIELICLEGYEERSQYMEQLCKAVLSCITGESLDNYAWLLDIRSLNQSLYEFARPYGTLVYAEQLCRSRSYSAFTGMYDAFLEMAGGVGSQLVELYLRIKMAAMHWVEGEKTGAVSEMKNALELALPDRLYLPFAEHYTYCIPILEEINAGGRREDLDNIVAFCERQRKGVQNIRRLHGGKSILTEREKEIVSLSQQGMTAKQVAEKLGISPQTVRTTLRNIYSKLGIHSKVELSRIEL